MDNLSGSSSLEKNDSPSLNSPWLPRALHAGEGPCKIAHPYAALSTSVVIALCRWPYCRHFAGAASLSYTEDANSQQACCSVALYSLFCTTSVQWYLNLGWVIVTQMDQLELGIPCSVVLCNLTTWGFLQWSLSAEKGNFSEEGRERPLAEGRRISIWNEVRRYAGLEEWQFYRLVLKISLAILDFGFSADAEVVPDVIRYLLYAGFIHFTNVYCVHILMSCTLFQARSTYQRTKRLTGPCW